MAKPIFPALPFIRASITSGLGPSQTYDQFLAIVKANEWRGMRKQDFLRLYSQTVNVRESVKVSQYAQRNAIPSTIENRDTIRARGYGQWVGIHMRTAGQNDYIFQPYLVKTAEPITPERAEQVARDFVETQADEYNRVIIGVGYLSTERFIPTNPEYQE